MNSSDFEALMGNTFGNLTKLSASKGLEYSGKEDRLANFKEQAKILGFASPIQVLGVYLNKHLGSINKFIAGGTASSEPIEGRIDDAILYLVLLKALIKEGQTPKDPDWWDQVRAAQENAYHEVRKDPFVPGGLF